MDPAITKYTFQLPVDTTRPVSPACFETCAKDFESSRLSYDKFLDAALAHIVGGDLLVRHPEDCDLADLAKLTTCGPMGPVAAAIKLCMLCECDERGFPQEAIDMLRRMDPSAAASDVELHHATLPVGLSPLQLQVVILAALRRGLPNLATDILLSGPEPPEKSLFNLLGSDVCPVDLPKLQIFEQFPIAFWTAAVRARWVMPSPELARLASNIGPRGAPLLRALLDNPALDVALVTHHLPLYELLLIHVAEKHDDASLLRDTLARLPPHTKLNPHLLRTVVQERSQGGVEMLAMLLDHRDGDGDGLDINYRDKKRVSMAVLTDVWSGNWWYQESMTPLHKAAERGNADAVRFLISRGANVNEPEYNGQTARDLALKAGHHEIVRLFDEVAKQNPEED